MLSRFPLLWTFNLLLILVISTLCNLSQAAPKPLFIDPYLQDIRDSRGFEPKKFGLSNEYTILEPSKSRLLNDPLMIQDGSRVVEVRVPPPQGFLFNGVAPKMPEDLQGKQNKNTLFENYSKCPI